MQFNQLKRREFISLLGGAAAAWPFAARAQQPTKLPVIGLLGTNISSWSPWTAAFEKRLRELGWIEGRTIAIEYRWDEGRVERDAEIAAEFVRLKVDVIVTVGSAVPTVKQATAVIPIVFPIANDPVGGGLVASLGATGRQRHWTLVACRQVRSSSCVRFDHRAGARAHHSADAARPRRRDN